MSELSRRKVDHLDLCANEDVEARRGTLLDQVHLLHDALPDLSTEDVDASVRCMGKRLEAPLLITGMTGGADRATAVNRALASVAQKHGFAFGLGSQRAMERDPSVAASYQVRDVAPDVLLFGNLGAVQARDRSSAQVGDLVGGVGADAICIHLNVAQELVQDEGDRDFRGCVDAIQRLVEELPVPVIAKETGCGLGPAALDRLHRAGVRWVDVSGAGGTSWPGVESLRGSERQHALGSELREWGIPTAACIRYASARDFSVIASGGIRGAVDAVRSLVLGGELAGLALPFFRAYERGGVLALDAFASRLVEGIHSVMLLVGARCTAELRELPRVLGPELREWIREPERPGPEGREA